MSAGHTRGPWACTTRRGSWDWVVYCEADPNIEICQPFHDGTEFNETGEANSRLIAAAPSLLAAVQELLSAHDTNASAFCLDNLRVAVAKATGTPNPLPNPDNQMPGGRVK